MLLLAPDRRALALRGRAREADVVVDGAGVRQRVLVEELAEREGRAADEVALAVLLLGLRAVEDVDDELRGRFGRVAVACTGE